MKSSWTGGPASVAAIMLAVGTLTVEFRGREVRPADTRPVAAATKVLHFPQDQCLGVLATEDRDPRGEALQHNFDPSLPWAIDAKLLDLDTAWEPLGLARGEVTVPAGQDLALRILLRAQPSELIHPNLRDRFLPIRKI